jgi:hypothetical protein
MAAVVVEFFLLEIPPLVEAEAADGVDREILEEDPPDEILVVDDLVVDGEDVEGSHKDTDHLLAICHHPLPCSSITIHGRNPFRLYNNNDPPTLDFGMSVSVALRVGTRTWHPWRQDHRRLLRIRVDCFLPIWPSQVHHRLLPEVNRWEVP